MTGTLKTLDNFIVALFLPDVLGAFWPSIPAMLSYCNI
jgi:hypothetical protein